MTKRRSGCSCNSLRYDSVVRLTQYIPVAGAPASPDVFTSAWKEAFALSSPDGVLYRELCHQVPEWSALAKRIQGARAILQQRTKQNAGLNAWLAQLVGRTHRNVAALALANKLARIAWAVLAKEERYQPQA